MVRDAVGCGGDELGDGVRCIGDMVVVREGVVAVVEDWVVMIRGVGSQVMVMCIGDDKVVVSSVVFRSGSGRGDVYR